MISWKQIDEVLDKTITEALETSFASVGEEELDVRRRIQEGLSKGRDQIADEIVAESAKRTAWIGGGAALPDVFAFGGWTVMVASLAGDFALSLREDLAMLNRLAYLYGHDRTRETRKREALGLFAAVRAGLPPERPGSTSELARLIATMGMKHMAKRMLLSVGRKFFEKKLVAFIPGLGIALSGGVNYYSTRALGDYAKNYYKTLASVPAEVEARERHLHVVQECAIRTMIAMAKIDGPPPREELALVEDRMVMYGYSPDLQDAYRRCLREPDVHEPPSVDDLRSLDPEERQALLLDVVTVMLADGETVPGERQYLDFLRKLLGVDEAAIAALERRAAEHLAEEEATAGDDGLLSSRG